LNSTITNHQSARDAIAPSNWCLIFLPLVIWIISYQNGWNSEIFLFLNHKFSRLPDLFWTTFSLGGNGWFIFAILLPVIFFVPRIIFAALLSGIITGIMSNLAKSYFDTPRPAFVLDQASFHIIESPLLHSAMPSGHTMTVFAICTAIIFSAPKSSRNYLNFLWLLAIGTGLSRIAVGAHWPSDVLVGASLGIFCGLLGTTLIFKFDASKFKTYSITSLVLILISLVNIYILLYEKLDFSINQPVQYLAALYLSLNFIVYFFLYFKHQYFLKNHV
jgi:membrane-associated phospholipid phosphatase